MKPFLQTLTGALLGIALTALSFAAAIDLKLHYWPNATAAAISPSPGPLPPATPFCTKFLPQLEALTAATIADPSAPENRANARAAQSEFAALCAVGMDFCSRVPKSRVPKFGAGGRLPACQLNSQTGRNRKISRPGGDRACAGRAAAAKLLLNAERPYAEK